MGISLAFSGLSGMFSASSPPWYYSGLLHWYKLEEASGVRSDSFGGLNLSPSISDPGRVTGVQGYAINFVMANSQKISTATVVDFTGSWTIAFWVNPASSPANGFYHSIHLLGSVFGGGGGPHIKQAFNNRIANIYYRGNDNSSALAHADINADGSWTFVLFTNDAASKTLGAHTYKTGTLVSVTQAYLWTPVATIVPFHISTADGGNGLYFHGAIDEYALWNRVLSPSEMDLLYNNGLGITFQ